MALKLTQDKATKVLTSIPGWAQSYNETGGSIKGTPTEAYRASAWAFRSINIRADSIASAPLLLKDENDKEIEDHPVLDLLDTVNDEWNKGDLWRYTESAFCVFGAAYWHKVKAGNHIIELRFVNPTKLIPDITPMGISGFRETNKQGTAWPREDVIYFRGGYDPLSELQGVAPLAMAVTAAVGERNADKYMAAFFENFGVPPLILTTDQVMNDTLFEKVTEFWKKMFTGVKNQFKTGFIGSGLKPIQLSTSIRDMAMDKSRAEMHRTICVALGVDELLLSASGAADRTPVDAALYHLYTTTIIPRWSYYQEVLDAELIPEYPDLVERGAYFEFDQSEVKPLQNDQNEWAATLATLVEKGILKPEVAAVELGYNKKDVPGEGKPPPPSPAPIVVTPNPVAPADGNQPPAPVDETVMGGGEFIPTPKTMDLDKWYRKSIREFRSGKSASVDFITDKVDQETQEAIRYELAYCYTEDAIMDVFRQAKGIPGSQPDGSNDSGYLALARSIDRATKVLAQLSKIEDENG